MAAVRHVVVGGVGASLSLDDIARVARGEQVAIDTAAAERIKKESPAPAKGILSVPPPSNEPSEESSQTRVARVTDVEPPISLTREQARAACLARLMSLVNGHSKVCTGPLRITILATVPSPNDHGHPLIICRVKKQDIFSHINYVTCTVPSRAIKYQSQHASSTPCKYIVLA